MSKKQHEEAKAPDAFLTTSNQVLNWIEKHALPVFGAVGLLAVIGIGYVGYGYWQRQVEQKAAEHIYQFESDLKKAEKQVEEERSKIQAKGKKELEAPIDFDKSYSAIVESIKQAIRKESGTRAAVVSALGLSNFLLQQKQYANALEVLQLPTFHPGTGDLLGAFFRMQYGAVLIENAKPDEAIKNYAEIVDSKNLKAFHPEAMLKMGISHEMKGDLNKAREVYEKIGREYPNSEASSTANQYLRLMELNSSKG
ncbi:MAG: tol-pal system YbgF family protein [Bdellovibrionales bacterium]